MFSLAQRCVALYEYTGEVKITEREELLKLKDSAGTRTNGYKQDGNKLSLEINRGFLKLSPSWIPVLSTSFSLTLTTMKFLCCCYKVIHLSLHIFPLVFLFLLHYLCCSIYLFIESKTFFLTLLSLPVWQQSEILSLFFPSFWAASSPLVIFAAWNHLEIEGKSHKLWLKMLRVGRKEKLFFT